DGEAVTAPLAGTILPGVTRDSVIQLLKSWDIAVSERRLTMDDVFEAGRDGRLSEIFASGTAAVISPVGKLVSSDGALTVGGGDVGALAQRLYDALYGLQTGRLTDDLGWTVTV
ncbi:MAG: aminotransferase class IV, partial [Oscillospiraceae bacterium]|nr:aminotransferase class IV [Oscillospiraceae bacterium]